MKLIFRLFAALILVAQPAFAESRREYWYIGPGWGTSPEDACRNQVELIGQNFVDVEVDAPIVSDLKTSQSLTCYGERFVFGQSAGIDPYRGFVICNTEPSFDYGFTTGYCEDEVNESPPLAASAMVPALPVAMVPALPVAMVLVAAVDAVIIF